MRLLGVFTFNILPMQKISSNDNTMDVDVKRPKLKTMNFIRQFAASCSGASLPGDKVLFVN